MDGLKLEKVGPTFSSINTTPAKLNYLKFIMVSASK